jgi:hypothetical protein
MLIRFTGESCGCSGKECLGRVPPSGQNDIDRRGWKNTFYMKMKWDI